MEWSEEWDLSTIPDKLFLSERARRNAAKRIKPSRLNVQPCPTCGKMMNARQRRLPCPLHIPAPEKALRDLANVRRNDVFRSVAEAIEKRGPKGPGTWSVSPHGRFGVTLMWVGKGSDVEYRQDSQKPWREFGGDELLRAAGYPLDLEYMETCFIDEDKDDWQFWKVLPTRD